MDCFIEVILTILFIVLLIALWSIGTLRGIVTQLKDIQTKLDALDDDDDDDHEPFDPDIGL